MSFQDVRPTSFQARRSPARSSTKKSSVFPYREEIASNDVAKGVDERAILSSSADPPASDNAQGSDPRRVSNDILRYQREVGSLSGVVRNLQVRNSTEEWKVKMRLEEVQKLGKRIESQLKQLERNIADVPTNRASESRATHLKLTRDFRKMEVIYKGLDMDFRQKIGKGASGQQSNSAKSSSVLLENKENSDCLAEAQRLRQIRVQEEARTSEQMMREREAEVAEINKKMHQVNEIYKDLGQLVSDQQEQVDQVEIMMDAANVNTKSALEKVEHANGKKNKNNETSPNEASCHFMLPLESFQNCINEIGDDISAMTKRAKIYFALGGGSNLK